jgi:transposase
MKNPRYSPEVHERAVRMVFESRVEGQSLWSTIESVATKIGCAPQTLNDWVKQHQRDAGEREGPTTADKKRVAELERENRELRKANEILKLASAFFAQAELDRRLK